MERTTQNYTDTDEDPSGSEVTVKELKQDLCELRQEFEEHKEFTAKERGELTRRIHELEQEKAVLSTLGDTKVDRTAEIILRNFEVLSRRTKEGLTVSTKVDEHGEIGLREFFERGVDEVDVCTTEIKHAMEKKIAENMPMYEYHDEGSYKPKHLVKVDD